MKTELKTPKKHVSWLSFAAILSAIGASVCCIGPLLLLSLGIGGAWMSTLTSMETVRPFFLILTLIIIALGYRKLYVVPASCEKGDACATSQVTQKERKIFWIGTLFILLLLAFPWYGPLLLE